MGLRGFIFPITSSKEAKALRKWAKNVDNDTDTDWCIDPVATVKYKDEQYALVNTDGSGCAQYLAKYGYYSTFAYLEDEWVPKIDQMCENGTTVEGIQYIN